MKSGDLNADMFQEITLNKYSEFSKKKRQHLTVQQEKHLEILNRAKHFSQLVIKKFFLLFMWFQN